MLGVLRAVFKIGIMALIATATLYIRMFVNRLLRIAPNATIIQRKIDRPNVYLTAAPLQHAVHLYKDFDYHPQKYQSSL